MSRRLLFFVALLSLVARGKLALFAGEAEVTQPVDAPPVATSEVKRVLPEEAIWSEPVNDLRARIEFKRREIVNGTPILATYLVLKNVRNGLGGMSLPWSTDHLKFSVVDDPGNEVRNESMNYSGGGGLGVTELIIPNRGELKVDISYSGLGIPADKLALIDLGWNDNWVLDASHGTCFFKARLVVAKSDKKQDDRVELWHGEIALPPVLIPIGAEPIDSATVAERTEILGARMLDVSSGLSDEARQALSLIDDPRVVPWYLRAMETDRYDLKHAALGRLARLEGDEALAGIKKGMSTQGKDIGNCSRPELAASSANNIRLSAVYALARSPHPDAKSLLKSMTSDRYEGVRMTAMQAMARLKMPAAQEVLEKMAHDPSETVRNEAKRILEMNQKKPIDDQLIDALN